MTDTQRLKDSTTPNPRYPPQRTVHDIPIVDADTRILSLTSTRYALRSLHSLTTVTTAIIVASRAFKGSQSDTDSGSCRSVVQVQITAEQYQWNGTALCDSELGLGASVVHTFADRLAAYAIVPLLSSFREPGENTKEQW